MESLQQPDGHIRYRAREELNGVWMTAYVAPAFAGQPLPDSTRAAPRPRTRPPVGPGHHAIAWIGRTRSGRGVARARQRRDRRRRWSGSPFVQPPAAQSRGRKPGGRRQLRGTRAGAAHGNAKQRRNPGARRETADPTNWHRPPTDSGHHGAGAGSAPKGAVARRGTTSPPLAAAPAARRTEGQRCADRSTGSTRTPKACLEPGAPGLHGAGAAAIRLRGRRSASRARCSCRSSSARRSSGAGPGDPVSTLAATDGLAEALARIASSCAFPS